VDLELHPRVTVLVSATTTDVAQLLSDVLRGVVDDAAGEVEVDGAIYELSDPDLQPVELPEGVERLVLGRGDLPAGDSATGGTEDPAVTAVRVALDAVLADDGEPLPGALDLADRWAAAHPATPEDIAAAEAAVEAARDELTRAESAAGNLDPEDVEALEAAHQAVEDAEEGGGRLFKRGSKSKLEDAKAAEQEVLDRLGLSSYGAYLLLRTGGPDPVADLRADQAVETLRDAEKRLFALRYGTHSDQAVDLSALRAEAVQMLGREVDDNEVEQALRDLRQPPEEAERALRVALEAAGVDLEQEGDEPSAVVSAARAWLADQPDFDLDAVPSGDPEVIEMYLLARFAAHGDGGSLGSLPLIVDDALATVPNHARSRACDVLARLSTGVQVIYVTSQPEIEGWASGLGDAASVVRI
jgi:hypothetical protein